ncbi:MAG: glutamyl-tRNA amidotransferase [Betaproteobacteria bacterium RIFCSPLOWO2_12_FULL_63_13]|nr:MAG: glutamyl-tRNA amidotransferase [Betaproteobacteria bacterium RIFCSPLOWO2_12_FULL_63_13]
MDPTLLGAAEAANALSEGRIGSEELVAACLARIKADEDRVQAWAFLDPEHALRQARDADQRRREGRPLGPLHGIPVGVKDIIDTQDMPTEDGTVLHAGRTPVEDATVVSMLRAAGAIILGKTVTTELATYSPGKTRNPHNPEHTPGGSSSGSAAAVAAHMVPLAIGTQTNGSVIRPAAYCGVVGFKPGFGLISRHGILKQSRPLDQVGVITRSVEDAAFLAEQLIGYDENDPDTRPVARPLLRETAMQEPPVPPTLAFVKTPMWKLADAQCHEAFSELVAHLGDRVEEIKLPMAFKDAWKWHQTVMEADLAKNFEIEYAKGRDKLSEVLRGQIERGRRVRAVDYNKALDNVPALNHGLSELFEHRYEAILTPATAGTAPQGLASTGSPAFCTLWTLCGLPAITLPLMQGADGLPLGVQLVGPRGGDARLLRTARWLVDQVAHA